MAYDQEVRIRLEAIVEVLRALDIVVVSLDRMGSETSGASKTEQSMILDDFVRDWKVFRLLAHARGALCEALDANLPRETIEQLERESEDCPVWSMDRKKPPRRRNKA